MRRLGLPVPPGPQSLRTEGLRASVRAHAYVLPLWCVRYLLHFLKGPPWGWVLLVFDLALFLLHWRANRYAEAAAAGENLATPGRLTRLLYVPAVMAATVFLADALALWKGVLD
jgi:hypothetical protein